MATERTVELVEEQFGVEWKYKEYAPHAAHGAFKEISAALKQLQTRYASK